MKWKFFGSSYWLVAVNILLAVMSQAISAAPIVYTTDFIDDASRTEFNSFEAIPVVVPSQNPLQQVNPLANHFVGQSGPYSEGGLEVTQVNGDPGYSIWTVLGTGQNGSPRPNDGGRTWYPDGGDLGFTRVRLSDARAFGDVGMLVTAGSGLHDFVLYQLLARGVTVLEGHVGVVPGGLYWFYLGFGGGGFDEIRLRSVLFRDQDFDAYGIQVFGQPYNSMANALAIDAIEAISSPALAGVPEPGAIWLVAIGLVWLYGSRARRRCWTGACYRHSRSLT